MNTNLIAASTNSVTSNLAVRSPEWAWAWIVGLMFLGAVIGTIAQWCYQLTISSPADAGARGTSGWALLKNFGMGIGAVALVPAFLQTISSSLLAKAENDIEARFVLVSFSVAAAFAARRFLAMVPEKILDSIKDATVNANQAKNQADQAKTLADKAQERIEKVTGALANKTAGQGLMSAMSETSQTSLNTMQASGYDKKCLSVIYALLNPKFSKSRTVTGMALDAGLTVDDTLKCLNQMQAKGDVQPSEGDFAKGTWWALTQTGRIKFASLHLETPAMSLPDSDIQ